MKDSVRGDKGLPTSTAAVLSGLPCWKEARCHGDLTIPGKRVPGKPVCDVMRCIKQLNRDNLLMAGKTRPFSNGTKYIANNVALNDYLVL